jgi:hypothetical protein
MTTLLVKAEWETFRRDVIPAGAPPVQIQEMRRAFYAGAHAIFQLLLRIMDPASEEPTAGDLMAVTHIDRELKEFVTAVLQGKA